jgi:hypothetical protein
MPASRDTLFSRIRQDDYARRTNLSPPWGETINVGDHKRIGGPPFNFSDVFHRDGVNASSA